MNSKNECKIFTIDIEMESIENDSFFLNNLKNVCEIKGSFAQNLPITKIIEFKSNELLISSFKGPIKKGIHKLNSLNNKNKKDFFNFELSVKKEYLFCLSLKRLDIYKTSNFKLINSIDFSSLSQIKNICGIDNEIIIFTLLGQCDLFIEYTNYKHSFFTQKIPNAHSKEINCLCLIVNRDLLLTGSNDKTIKLWNILNQKFICSYHGHSLGVICIEMCIDQEYFLSGSFDKAIKLWHLDKSECLRTFYGHESLITCLHVTKYNNILSLSNDGILKQWDYESGDNQANFNLKQERITSFTILDSGDLITGTQKGNVFKWSNKTSSASRKNQILTEQKIKLCKSCSIL
ncbi:unnamed protein product [Brachionus calyciflorus]|uniref:Uncharacterized protein n=1 Tax=Brachionus calyciflorus TaxID=104777 RepID=A0A814E160_9BILA|nr:unnamed protein product [Brachionus calyciflorus]